MRAAIVLALVLLTACEQATEPVVSPNTDPAFDIVFPTNEAATVEIEAAAQILYTFNNCLTGVFPNYIGNTACTFNDTQIDVASDANFFLAFLFLLNDPPPAEQIPEILITPAQAITYLQQYKTNILNGYNAGLVTCRARFATHKVANDIIASIQRLIAGQPPAVPSYIAGNILDPSVNIFGGATKPNGQPCEPAPPPPPPPAPGAIFYSVWAGNTSCQQSSQSQDDDDDGGNATLKWSGSKAIVGGNVHSNGEVKITGSKNEFQGEVTYRCGSTPKEKKNIYFSPPENVAAKPSPASFTRADFICTHNKAGTLKLNDDGPWWVGGRRSSGRLVDGVYCATGDIELSTSNVQGNVTLIAGGTIKLSGSRTVLRPFSKNVLAFAERGQVTVSGANSAFWGTIYAPKGLVHLSGGSNSVSGALVGDRVQISGSSNKVFGGFVQ